MYKLKLSRKEKRKILRAKWLILAAAILAVALVVWLAWIRPTQKESKINSFEECVAAGNMVQESYPEVCLTNDGKRLVNTKQQQIREASREQNDLVPPSSPAHLRLDIEEWGVRVPLTMETFDLSYTYLDTGDSQTVRFTYKRLLKLDACEGSMGLTLTRSFRKNDPPYTKEKPAPVAQVDKAYFYTKYDKAPCYDTENIEQTELVKKIAGDQTLTQATADLLTKMTALPEQ